jgi:hypothetical protein
VSAEKKLSEPKSYRSPINSKVTETKCKYCSKEFSIYRLVTHQARCRFKYKTANPEPKYQTYTKKVEEIIVPQKTNQLIPPRININTNRGSVVIASKPLTFQPMTPTTLNAPNTAIAIEQVKKWHR